MTRNGCRRIIGLQCSTAMHRIKDALNYIAVGLGLHRRNIIQHILSKHRRGLCHGSSPGTCSPPIIEKRLLSPNILVFPSANILDKTNLRKC